MEGLEELKIRSVRDPSDDNNGLRLTVMPDTIREFSWFVSKI